MKLLTVLGYSANDAVGAEFLADFIYFLNGKKPFGHCLLVAAADAHAEMRLKVKIAAEVAFESVSELVCTASPLKSKSGQTNNLFKQAAEHIAKNYRFPFLWLEPDCVPLKPDWREQLADAYDNQPKKYLGAFLKAGESLFMARTGIYPTTAFYDLKDSFDSESPFERTASIVPRATKTMLVQCGQWQPEDKLDKIRADAVLFHSDKNGSLIQLLRDRQALTNGHIPVPSFTQPAFRQTLSQTMPILHIRETLPAPKLVAEISIPTAPRMDMRTKAGRALKAQSK